MNDAFPKPICSIIIPVYNGEKFIQETIESCLNQTEQNIEIIAIDDASTDDSWNLIKQKACNTSTIVLKKNTENLGISKTVNIGAGISKGKYILILGQDDLIDSRHVETMLSEFEEGTSFVYCNAEVIDQDGRFLRIALDDNLQLKKTKSFMVYSSFENIISSTGTIISKKYFDIIGGWDEIYRNYGEWVTWIKLAQLGTVKYTTKIRAKYRRHDANITNTFHDDDVVKELEKFKSECRTLAVESIDNSYDKILRIYIKYRCAIKYRIKKVNR